ncbi:putative Rab effector MYRIP protein, partial [Naja naja]
GSVYGLESQLNELEDAARKISTITAEAEVADLEEQVTTAAAHVNHAELQISDIESRISALSVAGLNVGPYVHLTRRRDHQTSQMHTIDTSRQQRRKLPAPPMKGNNNNNDKTLFLLSRYGQAVVSSMIKIETTIILKL